MFFKKFLTAFHHGILSDICLMRIFTTTFLDPVQMISFFAVSRMHFCSSGHSIMSQDERSESARVTGCIRRIFDEHSDRGYCFISVNSNISNILCIRSGQGFLHIAILTIRIYTVIVITCKIKISSIEMFAKVKYSYEYLQINYYKLYLIIYNNIHPQII